MASIASWNFCTDQSGSSAIRQKLEAIGREPALSPETIVASASLRSQTLGSAPGDFVELEAVLKAAGLPSSDIGLTGRIFWRFRDSSGRIVAYGGIELHGKEALLRSITTLPEARGQGFGAQVSAFLVGYARLRGIDRVWLLTTAADFFRKLGFAQAERAHAPDAIR